MKRITSGVAWRTLRDAAQLDAHSIESFMPIGLSLLLFMVMPLLSMEYEKKLQKYLGDNITESKIAHLVPSKPTHEICHPYQPRVFNHVDGKIHQL